MADVSEATQYLMNPDESPDVLSREPWNPGCPLRGSLQLPRIPFKRPLGDIGPYKGHILRSVDVGNTILLVGVTVEARKLKRDLPQTPNQKRKENQHTSYLHVPSLGAFYRRTGLEPFQKELLLRS